MSSCRNDCKKEKYFPRMISNRAGLDHIDYRIGTYCDFRNAIFEALDTNRALGGWTNREAQGDPGISLLLGVSVLGDILTFYQDLYANEAYLRTAKWRESIADLVRLTGYRLSPAVGGRASLAFEVKGKKPVSIPAGFQTRAQLESPDKAAEFENREEAVAYPHLGTFNLYRPREPKTADVTTGINSMEIETVDGKSDVASISQFKVNPGDRIMIVPQSDMFDTDDTTYKDQIEPVILIVKEVNIVLDRTIIKFEGSLTLEDNAPIRAYRIKRSFRHFGYNAQPWFAEFDEDTLTTTKKETNYNRSLDSKFLYSNTLFNREYFAPVRATPGEGATTGQVIPRGLFRLQGYGLSTGDTSSIIQNYLSLSAVDMPLDEEVEDLAVGGRLICQGSMSSPKTGQNKNFAVVREITGLRQDTLIWGNLTAPSTVVTLDVALFANTAITSEVIDIRRMNFHEVSGPKITLRAPCSWPAGLIAAKKLFYFGTYDEARLLAGRRLLMRADDSRTAELFVTNNSEDFLLVGKDRKNPWMWPIYLNKVPDKFLYEDFDEVKPSVTVYGNVVDTDQGKTERKVALGNGDKRQVFQTFKLPKTPLTYLNRPGATPPETPELSIYVNDRLWTRVDSFFDRGPDEKIYIVREDSKGESWVQFGDGKTGARIDTGYKNVTAVFRTGVGAYGALKEETMVQPADKLDRLEKIHFPGVATGGAEPESGENAKESAPGKTQALGRLVSLKDYESEVLAIPGVTKASAAWKLFDNIQAIVLTVLMESGRGKEFEAVASTMNQYNRCRGPYRHHVKVVKGRFKYLYVRAEVAFNPTYNEDVVRKGIKEALGISGGAGESIAGSKGLFNIGERSYGEREYATRISGVIQNVDGVMWNKVTGLESLEFTENPADLKCPEEISLNPYVTCGSDSILRLYWEHLEISAISGESTEACNE